MPVQGARGPSPTTFLKTTQALLLTEAWSRMYTQERRLRWTEQRAVVGLWGGGAGGRSPELPIKMRFYALEPRAAM